MTKRAAPAVVAPKIQKPLLAYSVSENDEGYSDIVFARSTAEARRQMMGEWDKDFNQLSTKRMPELDNLPDADLEQWKFDNGWWATCAYRSCPCRCTKDDGAVREKGDWYCSTEHRDLEAQRARDEAKAIEIAEASARRMCPGIEIHHVYINAGGEAILSVILPGEQFNRHVSIAWLVSEEGTRA